MTTIADISVEEYLRTSYRPDCDYVDGLVLERAAGQYEHSTLQMLVLLALGARAAEWGILFRPELRLKVRPGKFRVPDVMVLSAKEKHPPVIEAAPLLCIEIASPDDTLSDLTKRANDYLELGVPETWILDPQTHRAYVHSQNGLHEVKAEVLSIGRIELNLLDVFSQLS